MKKNLFLLSAVVMLFASCEGPAGRDGLDGKDGEGYSYYVKDVSVRARDWELTGHGKYVSFYKYEVKADIGEDTYSDGNVSVYMFPYADDPAQSPLPYWVQHTEGDNTWLEGYNYEFYSDWVIIYLDWRKDEPLPDMDFRIIATP
jgi:hypothetical protein